MIEMIFKILLMAASMFLSIRAVHFKEYDIAVFFAFISMIQLAGLVIISIEKIIKDNLPKTK
jgi:hypothetical protein